MKRKIILCGLSLYLLAAAVSGCSGGGNNAPDKGDDAEFSSENMTMQKVGTDSTVCKAGHSTEITVTIHSENSSTVKNVPVSVIFVKKTKDENSTDENEEQFYAGTYLIKEVTPGTASYTLKIIVPDIGTTYSSFTVLAMFYNNLCDVYNGKDNISDDEELPEIETESLAESDEVNLDPSLVDQPDLMIENASLSSDIMVLYTNSIENYGTKDPISITYDVQVLAKDISDAKIKFYLKTLDDKKSWQMNINQGGTVKTEISLPALTKYEKQTMNSELLFPDEAFQTILETAKTGTEVQYPFYIKAVVSSASEPADFISTNNSSIANFYINPDDSILPEKTPKKVIGCSYNKYFGNSYFGAGFNFSAYTGIDKDKIYSDNNAKLPVHLYHIDFNFFELKLTYRSYFKGKSTDGQKPGVVLKASGLDPYALAGFPPKIATAVYYSYENALTAEWKTEGVLPVANTIIPILLNAEPNSNGSISLPIFENNDVPKSGSCYISRSYTYAQRFMIGPIPVEVGFSFTGGVGFGAFVGLQDIKVAAGFVPYFHADAEVYACVGFRKIFSIGAAGHLQIIQGELKNVVWLGWDLSEPDVDNNVFLVAKVNAYSGVTLSLLKGKLYGFVTYPWPKFRKKYGIRYFAGFEEKEARKYFWEMDNWAIVNDFAVLPKKTYNILIPLDSE